MEEIGLEPLEVQIEINDNGDELEDTEDIENLDPVHISGRSTPRSLLHSPTNAELHSVEGLSRVLRPITAGLKTALQHPIKADKAKKASLEVDKLSKRYLANKIAADQQPMYDRMEKMEKMCNFLHQKFNTVQAENVSMMEQLGTRVDHTELERQNGKDLKGNLDQKLNVVRPNTHYPSFDAPADQMQKAQKSLTSYVQTLPPKSLQKCDQSILDYLVQCNSRSTEFHLSKNQAMRLLVSSLPVNSSALTAVEEVRPNGLSAVYERLLVRNSACNSRAALIKQISNWYVPNPDKFGEAYDELLNLYKQLKPEDYGFLTDLAHPTGHKAFYEIIFLRLEQAFLGSLKLEIQEALASLRQMTDIEVAQTIQATLTKISNKIPKLPNEVVQSPKRHLARTVGLVECDEDTVELDLRSSSPKPSRVSKPTKKMLKGQKLTENMNNTDRYHDDDMRDRHNEDSFPDNYSAEMYQSNWIQSSWVKPWPEDKPVMNGKTISNEVVDHFRGYCFRCGSGRHSSDQCTRYTDDQPDSWSLCDICRAGFHTYCLSSNQKLWPTILEHFGIVHMRRLEALAEQSKKYKEGRTWNSDSSTAPPVYRSRLWNADRPHERPAFQGKPIQSNQIHPHPNRTNGPDPHVTQILRHQAAEDKLREREKEFSRRQQAFEEREQMIKQERKLEEKTQLAREALRIQIMGDLIPQFEPRHEPIPFFNTPPTMPPSMAYSQTPTHPTSNVTHTKQHREQPKSCQKDMERSKFFVQSDTGAYIPLPTHSVRLDEQNHHVEVDVEHSEN